MKCLSFSFGKVCFTFLVYFVILCTKSGVTLTDYQNPALFRFPHLSRTKILWCNEWFYKVNYEDQICLSWPILSVCQFQNNSTLRTKFSCEMMQGGQNPNELFRYSLVESSYKFPHFSHLHQVCNGSKMQALSIRSNSFSYGQTCCVYIN